jgi:hypothetical protein
MRILDDSRRVRNPHIAATVGTLASGVAKTSQRSAQFEVPQPVDVNFGRLGVGDVEQVSALCARRHPRSAPINAPCNRAALRNRGCLSGVEGKASAPRERCRGQATRYGVGAKGPHSHELGSSS